MLKYVKILLLAVCLFVAGSVYAQQPYKDFKPFKMVFLPNIYLSFPEQESDSPVLFKESLVIFQDVIRNLNQQNNVDFWVFGGNLTNNDDGKYTDLPMFLDAIADLKTPYYAIFGDREAALADENITKADFAREFEAFDYENTKQTFWSTEPSENVLLIGLDTSVSGEEKGYLNIYQLFWLDNILKQNKDKFTVITMHHSPFVSLEKPELFLELMRLYPQVKVVLSGHDMAYQVKQNGNALFINCPSIVQYPNEYKILQISPTGVNIETKKISFKQIIKKSKKKLGKNYQKPEKFSKNGNYLF